MSMIFLIVQLPTSWGVSFVMKRYGLRWCMIIFGVLTFIGMWIRCFGYKKGSETYLWIAFCGQTLIAIGQPFVHSISGLLSVNWFGDKERTLVQVVTLLMGLIGGGVSFAIGPSLITMGQTAMRGSEIGMIIYLVLQAVIASACLVLIVIFVKDKPPTPPVIIKENQTIDSTEEKDEEPTEGTNLTINSESNEGQFNAIESGHHGEKPFSNSNAKDIYPQQTIWQGAKKLLTSPHFIMLTIGSSCLNSVFQTLAILEQLITPKGYTTFDNANIGLVHLVFVLIGCFGLSILFDKTKRFKLISCISSFTACIGFACFSVIMQWEKTDFTLAMVYLSFVVIGVSAIPSLPLISQMLVYSTYPVHPATSLVISSAIGTIWSVIFLVIVNVLQSEVTNSSNIILWMDLSLLIIGFVMVLLFRGKFDNVLVNKK
ncbi:predicted protein [Naegleria gruberi]|uniref:Predicted protein n=1 Tax=Naegleria gruberi TaxID=5762 RepID=D2V9J2_NAEGR|nr:uncharacterized protein NAEGRDRAFT_65462 [Naegleria gruberi]EFC46471.1 predicted protein [Naegleria gruberi]|eukprot:XP_002679215.1 predicted protein [Naegleria gruberi strain NEG-M]